MGIDVNSLIQWLIPTMFWFGVVVGLYVGTVVTLIVVWRKSGDEESE